MTQRKGGLTVAKIGKQMTMFYLIGKKLTKISILSLRPTYIIFAKITNRSKNLLTSPTFPEILSRTSFHIRRNAKLSQENKTYSFV